ncbi:homeodomain-interacting protein kinase 1-like isoform X2 [Scophthalmus maximus]|nr:homeodomain-interacting protein kinase 1-like isoform X2 [Scophthalmus maximus]XP_035485301.1 homeodomain-interacting protein kinase 1-like isoform X2 [Scophthalmus maximus]
MKTLEACEVSERDVLCSSTSKYLIKEFIGEGCFSKVARGANLFTSQDVALKLLKSERSARREIRMLEAVSALDPVKKNVVRFLETFVVKEQTCLVFEVLDRNLYQLLRERQMKPLSPNEIRPIAHQLVTAFNGLKGLGVIHSDLKPDNIMLVNHVNEPFRVKIIDFGVSFMTSDYIRGQKIQPLGYRAPEVTLGLPVSEAIDMWSLGCVLVLLYIVHNPFSKYCEYQSMGNIVDMLGQPADHLLDAGFHTNKFFEVNQHWNKPRWWMKTPKEYQLSSGLGPKKRKRDFKRLSDLITIYPERQGAIELEDRRAFVSLLSCLLDTDPAKRITPERALAHPFLTMVHLAKKIDIKYFQDSLEKMKVLGFDNLKNGLSSFGETTSAAKKGTRDQEPSARTHPTPAKPHPTQKTPAKNESSPAKVKKSRLKRIRNFFGRIMS